MKNTQNLVAERGTFIDIYQVGSGSVLYLPRESGCLVIVPAPFRKGNWKRFRIGYSNGSMPNSPTRKSK